MTPYDPDRRHTKTVETNKWKRARTRKIKYSTQYKKYNIKIVYKIQHALNYEWVERENTRSYSDKRI